MIERSEYPGLAPEPLEPLVIVGQECWQNFRATSRPSFMSGRGRLTHSAGAEQGVNAIVPGHRPKGETGFDIEEAPDDIPDGRVDEYRRGVVCQERVHLTPEVGIGAARIRQKGCARVRFMLERGFVDLRDVLPAFGGHRVSVSPSRVRTSPAV